MSKKHQQNLPSLFADEPLPFVDPFKPNPRPSISLLALDIATSTGFCTHTASGTWDFSLKRDESKGMRLIRFRAKIKEVCAAEEIKLVVYEQPAIYGKFPNLVAAELVGTLKVYCEEMGVNYRSYAPTAIKKFGTGKGVADKATMINAAQAYKPTVSGDDEADAIILYHLAIKDLEL